MLSTDAVRAAGLSARRHHPARVGLMATIAAITLLTTGCSPASSGLTSPPVAQGSEKSLSTDASIAVAEEADPGSSLIAQARHSRVPVHSAPGGRTRQTLNNPTEIGSPLAFLVLERRPGWLKVQLPVRPNGASGWVADADVTLSTTPYRLVISLSKHRLDVMYEGRRIARHEVGVGKVATPTPKGTYYLTDLIKPPDPKGAYGPYAFGLSAFSNTLKTFAGGPGQLGLHGTDAPHGLGRDISHGCIRVSNSVITELAGELPIGTPVDLRT